MTRSRSLLLLLGLALAFAAGVCGGGLIARRLLEPAAAPSDPDVIVRYDIIGSNRAPAIGDSSIVCALGRTASGRVFLLMPAYVIRRRNGREVEVHTRLNAASLCRANTIDGLEVRWHDWRLTPARDTAAPRIRM